MNTEPDEYDCACPPGYSGKDCQIGQPCTPTSSHCLCNYALQDVELYSSLSRARLCFQPLRQWRHVSRAARSL